MAYVFGTPSAKESSGLLWKRFPTEPDVTGNDYEKAYLDLGAYLSRRYVLCRGDVRGDLYVRGVFFGDRTQWLELYRPELIGDELISYLQEWLRHYDDGAWRVVIPTGDEKTTKMVYPHTVA